MEPNDIEELIRFWQLVTGKQSLTIPKTGPFESFAHGWIDDGANGYRATDNGHSVSIDWSD